MHSQSQDERTLRTSAGDFPLDEYRLRLAGGAELKVLHVSAVLSQEEESHFLRELRERLPYGVTLWASAIALAHEVTSRSAAFAGRSVLELGAGTGLPGMAAARAGARVVQTDRYELVMSLCRRNASRNRIETLEQRLVDWAEWGDGERYDWIIGSDILYAGEMHPHLRRIFETNLAPGGRLLLADPFREASLGLLEVLEAGGWSVAMSKWSVGSESTPRPVGVFELTPPPGLTG